MFDRLVRLVGAGSAVVLSGAGISTESGIPDYRGPTGRARPAAPMTFGEFTSAPAARQRYWARSFVGLPAIQRARPNAGHRSVARLQRAGLINGVITQNVDGLHQAAGSHPVIELHGSLERVRCLACAALSDRDELDARLQEANPQLAALRAGLLVGGAREVAGEQAGDEPAGASVRPDGDVDLPTSLVESFRVVDCLDCGAGPLKPEVVFFGESVPAQRVAACYGMVDAASVLLVLGSSLTVASGYRFVLRAVERGIPVAIVNQGSTRGDRHADCRVDAPLGATLTELVRRLDRDVADCAADYAAVRQSGIHHGSSQFG